MYVGSRTPGWLYALGIPPRADFPLRTPRARATDLGPGPNLRAGSGRAPCVPRSREHEEGPAAGREKNAEGPKKHIYIYIYMYKIPFRDVGDVKSRGCRKLEKVTQEKRSHVVLVVAEKSAGVLYCEKGREIVSKNTCGSLGMYQV